MFLPPVRDINNILLSNNVYSNSAQCNRCKIQKKEKRWQTRLSWIDNLNDDITTLGLTMREALDMKNDQRPNTGPLKLDPLPT